MLVPESFRSAYALELEIVEAVAEHARAKLRPLSRTKTWLFDERIKSVESAFSKLEAGGPSLSSLHDFYAATIVVPTQDELAEAIEALSHIFSGSVKPSRTRTPNDFRYDDLHFIATLEDKVSSAIVAEPVRKRPFEIQVRTSLEYAWWRATHDQIYKSAEDDAHGWAVMRASSQAKASLELLDSVLANLGDYGKLQRPVAGVDPELPHDARAFISVWPDEARPHDLYRFAGMFDALLAATATSPATVLAAVATPALRLLVDESSLPAGQVLLAALADIHGEALITTLSDASVKIFISEELMRERPLFASFTEDGRLTI